MRIAPTLHIDDNSVKGETMSKPIVCIDRETGKVIKDFQIRWTGKVGKRENVHLRVFVNDICFESDNIGKWEEVIETEEISLREQPFGAEIPIETRRKFSKVYQLSEPQFSKDQHAAIWLKVERHTQQDTGVVFRRDHRGCCLPLRKTIDWTLLTGKDRKVIRSFLSECYKKLYLARIVWDDDVWWFVNPEYHWNGNMIPRSIHQIFQTKQGFNDAFC